MLLWSALDDATERAYVEAEIIALNTDPYRIGNHPAIVEVNLDGRGTFTASIDADDWVAERPGRTIAEDGTYSSDEMTFEREAVSAGLVYRQREMSTHVATALGDRVGVARTLAGFVREADFTRTNQIAAAVASFSASYGDYSSGFGLEELTDAIQAHETATGGEAGIAIMHPSAVKKLIKDSLFQNAMTNAALGPEFQALKKLYAGSYIGRVGNVDLFQASGVAASGGKYQNAIFSRGGVAVAKATPVVQSADQVVVADFRFTRIAEADTPAGTVRWEKYMGAAVAHADKGGLFLTDVP